MTLLEVELEHLMAKAPVHESQIFLKDRFIKHFDTSKRETGAHIDWSKIDKLPPDSVQDYETLPLPSEDAIREMLSKLIVVKLNGDLGTSLGFHGPKAMIPVRGVFTFLDLAVQQIEHINKKYNANVPLVLMNSFKTDKETRKIIRKYKGLQVEICMFQQSVYPYINKDTLLPVAKDLNINEDTETWYTPGHGDFYESFRNSCLLKEYLKNGREYCFISDINNLGATVDVVILNFLLNHPADIRPEFLMEVTNKTKADLKRETLIQYEKKLRLLEIAQVPKGHVDEFQSITTFKFFNTNNLWIKLDAIGRVLHEGTLSMDVTVNTKRLANNIPVIQLETAVGAGVKCFGRSLGINVPRRRLLLVENTSDLMRVMSNLYVSDEGSFVISPERMVPNTPVVRLGDEHFSRVNDLVSRFSTIPDMLELDHLTLLGDVTFGSNVSLQGTVIIIADKGHRIDIPSGAVIENKIITGNLRIEEH